MKKRIALMLAAALCLALAACGGSNNGGQGQGGAVENLYRLLGGGIEALEFTATPATTLLDTPLKDMNPGGRNAKRLKDGLLVAAIAREGQTIIPDGNTSIHAGDRVIVMAKNLFLQNLDDILQ